MFTTAKTLEFEDSEVGGNTFAEHREDILRLAQVLVQDVQRLLMALQGTRAELTSAASVAHENIGQLVERIRAGAADKMELEAEDILEQLDGAADPVSCNICHRLFEGKSKGIKLTSHKINVHFKDEFRRAVKDETRIDGYFHCKEENCTAKFKQNADMFKHLASVHKYLDRFMAAVPASFAPAPGPKKISDLHTQSDSSHLQEQVATGRGPQSLAATSSAETNQGIKTDGAFYINLCPSSIQSLNQLRLCNVERMVQ